MNIIPALKIIGVVASAYLFVSHAMAYKILPAHSVHESITAMSVDCLNNANGYRPNNCDKYQNVETKQFSAADYVKGIPPLYRAVSWPDDPTREFTDFKGAIASGAKVYLKDEIRCPQADGYRYSIDGDGLFCNSHFGQLQFFHAQASSKLETAEITHKKILDWANFLYEVAIGKTVLADDYCEFWRDRNSILSDVMAPNGFEYCDARFSVKEIFNLRKLFAGNFYPYYPPWTVGTLLNFTCSNPVSSSTCHERINQSGEIWGQQNAAGALLHLIQDSYSQSHAERGVCEYNSENNQPKSKIECSPINSYYAYGLQDKDLHGAADDWPERAISCDQEGSMNPVYASALILWHIENKTPWYTENTAPDTPDARDILFSVFGNPDSASNELATSGECFGKTH